MSRSHHIVQMLGVMAGAMMLVSYTARAQTSQPPTTSPGYISGHKRPSGFMTGNSGPTGSTPHLSLNASGPATSPSQPTISSAAQAPTFLRVSLAQKVLQSPLSLKVEGATLEDIAARVQQSLIASKSTPKLTVEVRKANTIRLNFAAKNSTVGEVLRSSGALAGVSLWVFSDHLLLAPQEALSPQEQDAVNASSALFSSGIDRSESLGSNIQAAFVSFVSNELKDGKTTFNQLSPDAQAMIQLLFTNTKESKMQEERTSTVISSALAKLDLSSNPTITNSVNGFRPLNNGPSAESQSIQIDFGKSGSMGWSSRNTPSGSELAGMSIRVSTPLSKSSPSALPPFVDPSAGNS